ncbi:MAG: helix-turn-helix domain-containing protein [Rubrivivax sp.]|nr:helix-turn-helix domain-containing protein [Rubrivivax sp.]
MLREARQARGLHVAALAASIKVTQRKLEALEADRYDELPDMTFTRALAKTVCRSLKIDSAPVLALLPEVGDRGLDRVHLGLNTTFRDRPGRQQAPDLRAAMKRPALWLPLLVLAAAVALALAPQGLFAPLGGGTEPAASAPAALPPAVPASVPATAAAASAPEAALPAVAPAPASVAAATPSAPAEPVSMIELRVTGESWIEVLDAGGAALLQRVLQPGEFVGLEGTPPFRLKIGNAAVTQLKYRGQAVDLAAATRDNVARLELK